MASFRHAFEVALAIDGERRVVLQAKPRLDRGPRARILGQDPARLGRGREIAAQNIFVRSRESLAEHVAGHRHRAACAERLLDIGHFNRAAEATPLEIGGEVPVFERGLGLALDQLLGDERRRAI